MDSKSASLNQFHESIEEISIRWGGSTPKDWEPVDSICKVVDVDKKVDLQCRGDKAKYSYYIVTGLLRFYYVTESGKELNKCFYREGDFLGDFSYNFLDQPSRFSIATIEPCRLVLLPITEYKNILVDSPELRFLSEQAMNTLMVRNERREEELLTMSAKERFLKFIANFPDYMDRIPQHHIASYLGITPEALSKYKKMWLREN